MSKQGDLILIPLMKMLSDSYKATGQKMDVEIRVAPTVFVEFLADAAHAADMTLLPASVEISVSGGMIVVRQQVTP